MGSSGDYSQSDYHHHTKQVYRPEIDTSGIDERKLMRKVDWHVIPWLALLYLLSYLDRGNVGNARVRNLLMALIRLMFWKLYNLERDLGINDNQYFIALTLFFFPYSLFEVCTHFFDPSDSFHCHSKPASNVLLRRLKPSIWLSTMMVLWGVVMVSQRSSAPLARLSHSKGPPWSNS